MEAVLVQGDIYLFFMKPVTLVSIYYKFWGRYFGYLYLQGWVIVWENGIWYGYDLNFTCI